MHNLINMNFILLLLLLLLLHHLISFFFFSFTFPYHYLILIYLFFTSTIDSKKKDISDLLEIMASTSYCIVINFHSDKIIFILIRKILFNWI